MTDGAENEDSENKTSFSELHDATISLAAFATARGGTVHFGIASDEVLVVAGVFRLIDD